MNPKLLLDLTNDLRGGSPLELDDLLSKAAQGHADWMAKKSRMSHRGKEFSSPSDRVKDQGYSFLAVAENVAAGYRSEEDVIKAWYRSLGHRRNMLNKSYSECGFGCRDSQNGKLYWCAVYAKPR